MINLLPPDDKKQLTASRANTLLLRYNIFLLGAVAFLGLAIGVAYVFLSSTKNAAEQTITKNEQEVASYASVKAQGEQLKSNLKTAKEILDKEVVYTKPMLAISNLLPKGIVLQNLNLDAQAFDTQTTIAIEAKNIGLAVDLKNSLEASPLFSNVHFENITKTTGANADRYPISFNLNVTIDKKAALDADAAQGDSQP